MQESDKPIFLFVFHSSVGEINWITPYIDYLYRNQNEYSLYSIFIDPKTHTKASQEKHNYNILSNCTTILGRQSLLSFIFKKRKQVMLIFKDFWPLKSNSLVANILNLCTNSKLVLFPHAYALYDINTKPKVFEKFKATHDSDVYDVLLLNSEYDVPYWSEKIPLEKIKVTGAYGYSDYWMFYIKDTYNEYISKKRGKSDFNILFSIRGPAQGYLLKEDYYELIDSALKVLLNVQDAHIFIRPHPRQSLEDLNTKLSKYDKTSYTVINDNSFVSSLYCDLAVNFWTSVISDNIAAGIPTIEYYKYNVENDQWFPNENGEVISFYTHFGMTKAVKNEEELREVLNNERSFFTELYTAQKIAFDSVFIEVNSAGERFLNIVEGVLKSNSTRQEKSLIKRLKAFFFIITRQMKYFYVK